MDELKSLEENIKNLEALVARLHFVLKDIYGEAERRVKNEQYSSAIIYRGQFDDGNQKGDV